MEEFSLNSFNLTDKVILITGGASGLGQYYTQAVSKVGADVFIVSYDRQGWEETRAAVETNGRKAVFMLNRKALVKRAGLEPATAPRIRFARPAFMPLHKRRVFASRGALGAAPALSLWAVRRRSPSCRSCYRSVFRPAGYGWARPSSAPVCPSCQALLTSALPPCDIDRTHGIVRFTMPPFAPESRCRNLKDRCLRTVFRCPVVPGRLPGRRELAEP